MKPSHDNEIRSKHGRGELQAGEEIQIPRVMSTTEPNTPTNGGPLLRVAYNPLPKEVLVVHLCILNPLSLPDDGV